MTDHGIDIVMISRTYRSFLKVILVVCTLLLTPLATLLAAVSVPAGAEFEAIQSYFFNVNDTLLKQVVVRDIDKNGFPDLVVLKSTTVSILLSADSGNGTYPIIRTFDLPTGLVPIALAVADFDGSNNLDLAVSLQDGLNTLSNARVTVYTNIADATFKEAVFLTAVTNPDGIVAADFDGDNIADIAVANSSLVNGSLVDITVFTTTRQVDAETGATTITFTAAQKTAAGDTGMLRSADMNDDNIDDLITDSEVYINDGAGRFVAQAELNGGGLIAVGRLDLDTLPDIVQLGGNQAVATSINVQLMNSNGSLNSIQTLQDSRANYSDIAIADVNQDGRGDILALDKNVASVKIFFQNCVGRFLTQPVIVANNGAVTAVASDFLNNDNLFDIVALSHNNGGNNASASVWLQVPPPAQPGTIQFCDNQVSVNEAGGTVDLEINRINGSAGAMNVNYTAAGFGIAAPAEPGADFNDLTAGTVTFLDGDFAPKLISFEIVDDILFEADETFSVTLNPDIGTVSVSEAIVTIVDNDINQLPQVNPGADQIVIAGETVTLDGSASLDPDGPMLSSYLWQQTSAGNVVAFTPAAANVATVTFVAPSVAVSTILTFQLTVQDIAAASATGTVSVTVNPQVNVPPTAVAGLDQVVNIGDQVVLDGSASTGTIVNYTWTQDVADALQVILMADQQNLDAGIIFTAPSVSVETNLNFQLTVSDGIGNTSTASMIVTVKAPPPPPPVANAGNDQTVIAGETVSLDGSLSTATGTIVSYLWQSLSDPGLVIQADTSTLSAASFVSPDVLEFAKIFTISLTVTDDIGATASDTISITVLPKNSNLVPNADAGSDQTVELLTIVNLDGGASSDSDGTIASYLWEQTAGSAVSLSATDSAQVSFAAPDLAQTDLLSFKLTVTDDRGDSAIDTVNITVTVPVDTTPDDTPTSKPAAEKKGLGAFDPVMLLLIVLLGLRGKRWQGRATLIDRK